MVDTINPKPPAPPQAGNALPGAPQVDNSLPGGIDRRGRPAQLPTQPGIDNTLPATKNYRLVSGRYAMKGRTYNAGEVVALTDRRYRESPELFEPADEA